MLEGIIIFIFGLLFGFFGRLICDFATFLFKVHMAAKQQQRERKEAIEQLERHINCDHEA